ncbi:MAG: NAD(P)/FAD-dependent oxidoreductase, partial [Armatimonadetes bacterium]|nr:NAD(P)/FAD-dependent oxidoreductase [Armatimonadota bacterium]
MNFFHMAAVAAFVPQGNNLEVTMAKSSILILGGGSGGIVAANELAKHVGNEATITLIDKNKNHIYAPAFVWLMLGKREARDITRPLSSLEKKNVHVVHEEILSLDPKTRTVMTQTQTFAGDYLITALGAETRPEKVPGLCESGYNFYSLPEVEKLRDDLGRFKEGRIAVVISSIPFKCPAAPYKIAFFLDEYFAKNGARNAVNLSISTPEPLPMPALGPESGKTVKEMLEKRGISFHGERVLASVDPSGRILKFASGEEEGYDLLIFVPPHEAPKVVKDAGLCNEAGWVPVDRKTMQTTFDRVYAVGDVTTIPASSGKPLPKAGAFAHLEAEVVAKNIISDIRGVGGKKEYDGLALCVLEYGYGKASLAKGNLYKDPPEPLKMGSPSPLWHYGKTLFEKFWLWKWF